MSCDVVIVGGGVVGLGIASALLKQKHTVHVLERAEIGSQTSSNSLRIVHGGFRYLQHADIVRTIQSIRDQGRAIRELPGLSPLRCFMPLERRGLKSRIPAMCGALAYKMLVALCGEKQPSPRVLRQSDVSAVTTLRHEAPHGVLEWTDQVMSDPQAVHHHLRAEIESLGGVIHEGVEFQSAERIENQWRISAIRGSEKFDATPHVLVNASGPWIEIVRSAVKGLHPIPPRRWCRALNVVVRPQVDPSVGLTGKTVDGRLLFAVPRGDGTAIGTWYYEDRRGVLGEPFSRVHIENFLMAIVKAFPGVGLEQAELIAIEAGVLPMAADCEEGNILPQGNEEILSYNAYLEVVSTKYTTFRSLGMKVARACGPALKRVKR